MHGLYSRVQPLDDDADAKKILTVSPLDLEFSLKISKYRNNETVADDRRWNFKRTTNKGNIRPSKRAGIAVARMPNDFTITWSE